MVPRPLVNAVLKCDRLEVQQQDLESSVSLISLVSEETMRAGGDAESSGKSIN